MASLREMMAAQKKAAQRADAGGAEGQEPGKPAHWVDTDSGRQLDKAQADGPHVPVDFPCESASDKEKAWWQARHCMETQLAVWIEPEGEHAWLCVKPLASAPPILLTRLPLTCRQAATEPF